MSQMGKMYLFRSPAKKHETRLLTLLPLPVFSDKTGVLEDGIP